MVNGIKDFHGHIDERLDTAIKTKKACCRYASGSRRKGKGERMEEKKIEILYKLLERAEREKDSEAAAALKWAIFTLEQKGGGTP